MGSPAIFAGKRSKLLSSKGLLYSNGSINDYNGDINYILNGHAEVNTAGWATYADAAQSTPVDGTGGSPTVTWTQTTTSPLYDSGSFVFTKDAVNRQGQGVSYAFTIDSASQAKVMTITCDYIVSSGTFTAGSRTTDSDLEVFIYDVTNSVLIQPSTYKFYSNSSTIASPFIANFQTPYNSTSYRLIFHCATTSASAYTVKFDNVKVSPTEYTYGTPITDWQNFPSTAAGTLLTASSANPTYGTVTKNQAMCRRVGGNLEFMWDFNQSTGGSAGTGSYEFNIPASIGTIDTSKITIYNGDLNGVADIATKVATATFRNSAASSINMAHGYAINSSKIRFFALYGTGSTAAVQWSATGFPTTGATNWSIVGSVPITGWSSCVQMSDQTTQQVITAVATGTPANVTAGNPIIYPTVVNDTTGSYNATTGRFTVPTPGYWQVGVTGIASTSTVVPINIYKNAVQSLMIGVSPSGNFNGYGVVYANAGDILDVRPVGSSITSFSATTNYNSISFTRVSGPASIAASEKVFADYFVSANGTASTTAAINYDSKIIDTHGAVTTGSGTSWRFTAPRAGYYSINAIFRPQAAVTALLWKNGASWKTLPTERTANDWANAAMQVYLNAGDYIQIRLDGSATYYGGTYDATYGYAYSITILGN